MAAFWFFNCIFFGHGVVGHFGFTYTAALHDQTRAEAGKIYYALKSAVDEGDLEQAVGYYSQLSDEDFPAVRRLAAFSLAMGRYEEKQYESAIILLQDVLEKKKTRDCASWRFYG